MKFSIRILVAMVILVFGFATIGTAQMMGGGHNHSSQMKADSKSENNQMGAMENMTNQCKMMDDDFGKLEDHFDSMMKIDDIKVLKAEMKKHQEIMKPMHEKMGKHMNMCKDMMSMMDSDGMRCMMGMNGKNSEKSEQNSHSH